MDEITEEQVWEMVKGIDLNKIIPDVSCRRDDPDGPHETVREWSIATDYEATLSPKHALALIVDAAKREMGEDFQGATVSDVSHRNRRWVAFWHDGCDFTEAFAPTESAAVLAAYRAWKEGR